MAFLAPTAGAASLSLRAAPMSASASSSVRRSVKATASSSGSSGGSSPHPILSSLRMAASAAVLLAATSPALASTPSAPPPPPTPITTAANPDGLDASEFQKLIVETAALAGAGDAEAARALLSAAEGCESLLAAQALFVDGKVDEAIAAFEELAQKDPADYRPLFCQSVLYLVVGKVAESESVLERCRAVGGDAVIADPAALMVSAAGAEAADAESGEEKAAEPEPAEV